MGVIQKDERLNCIIQINRARYTILFMVILSLVNIYTAFSNPEINMPFSSAISTYAVNLGIKSNSTPLLILCIAISVIIISALFLCYLKSKKNPAFFVFSFCLIIVDALSLLIMRITSINAFVIIDLVIHLMTIFYLMRAVTASKRIKEIDLNPPAKTTDSKIEEETYNDLDDESIEDNADLTQPISEYIDNGTPHLVSGSYNGLNIFVVIKNSVAELIINNRVCDRLNVAGIDEFELRVIVNEIDIIFDYKRSYNGETMYLYADNELLDSLGRE